MQTTDLIQIAERLGGKRVLLIGDLMLDRYLFGDAERISPEAPVPVLRAVDEQERVGGSGSVAANLQALGVEAICCGIVGNDPAGERLLKLLQSTGANCSGVLKVDGRPTTTKTRFVGLAQHRHRQQLLRFDQEYTQPITLAQLEYLVKIISKMISKVDVVCVEDYNKGLFSQDLVSHIVIEAQKCQKLVLVDPAVIGDFDRYRGTTLLTPNRNELASVIGSECRELTELGDAASELARHLGLQAIVVTVDRDGAILCTPDGKFEHIPTRPRAVYDNTGAGDAVLAMMAAALAAGADFKQAVQLANVAGGLEVEKFGAVPIAKDEIIADLRIEQRRRSGKIRTLAELIPEITLRRDRGETVVFTNGCFDLLHRGHVEYLREARQQGDILVVGLNSDQSVKKQGKSSARPIVAQQDRAVVLSALESVDYVVLFDDPTPEAMIESIRPDVLVKGEDWKDKGVVGQKFVESYGGKVVLAKLSAGFSTTVLIEKIKKS